MSPSPPLPCGVADDLYGELHGVEDDIFGYQHRVRGEDQRILGGALGGMSLLASLSLGASGWSALLAVFTVTPKQHTQTVYAVMAPSVIKGHAMRWGFVMKVVIHFRARSYDCMM